MLSGKLAAALLRDTAPSLPFLWKSRNSSRIYLRMEPVPGSLVPLDFCVVGDLGGTPGVFPQSVHTSNEDAWSIRLLPGQEVILSNT